MPNFNFIRPEPRDKTESRERPTSSRDALFSDEGSEKRSSPDEIAPRHPLERFEKKQFVARDIPAATPSAMEVIELETPSVEPAPTAPAIVVTEPELTSPQAEQANEQSLAAPEPNVTLPDVEPMKPRPQLSMIEPDPPASPQAEFTKQTPPHSDASAHDASVDKEALALEELLEKESRRPVMKYVLIVLILLCFAAIAYYSGVIPQYTRFIDRFVRPNQPPVEQPQTESRAEQPATPPQRSALPAPTDTARKTAEPPQSTVTTTSAGQYKYYLQVASFPSVKMAEAAKEQFIAKKLPVVITTAFSSSTRKPMHRVKIGPFASRSEIAAMRASFASIIPKDAFIDSVLSSEAPTSIAPPAPRSDTAPQTQPAQAQPATRSPAQPAEQPLATGYYIVISSLRQQSQADEEAQRLKKKGLDAKVQPFRSGTSQWYRVQLGPFASQKDAQALLQKVRDTHAWDAFLHVVKN